MSIGRINRAISDFTYRHLCKKPVYGKINGIFSRPRERFCEVSKVDKKESADLALYILNAYEEKGKEKEIDLGPLNRATDLAFSFFGQETYAAIRIFGVGFVKETYASVFLHSLVDASQSFLLSTDVKNREKLSSALLDLAKEAEQDRFIMSRLICKGLTSRLFREEVMKGTASGKIDPEETGSSRRFTLDALEHFVNNSLTVVVSVPEQEMERDDRIRADAANEKLNIIALWLYYHPKVMRNIFAI